MSSSLAYANPTQLQIPRHFDGVDMPPELRQLGNELLNYINNVVFSLNADAGVGRRVPTQWALLEGSPTTILASNHNRLYVKAGEALAYGDIINLYNNAGVLTARKADATTNAKPADGFNNTPAALAIGEVGEFILAHGLLPASGLTIGQRYFLSTTPGVMATTPAVAAGNIEQYLGVALSSEALFFNSSYWIQH